MDSVAEELTRRQVVFREVNENIARLTGLLTETGCQLFVCECSNTRCAEALELTVAEYEAIRAHGARFLVAPGHQIDDIERVVDGNGRFLVVEKIGDAAAIVEDDDPRHP